MRKYIDADFLASEIAKYNKDNWDELTWTSHMVHSLVMNAPTVDLEKVVYCKDCRHSKPCETDILSCIWGDKYVAYDDFCSDGEPKISDIKENPR